MTLQRMRIASSSRLCLTHEPTWCIRTGHGLGQTEHEADRWVAATAIWLQVPLVAHDGIFANVKDLELLTKLGD
jgi:hypothetical protein